MVKHLAAAREASRLLRRLIRTALSAPRVNLKTTAAPVDAGTRPIDTSPPVAAAAHVASDPRAPSRAEVRRHVWRRDKGQCSNCRSTFALEIDHVRPRAVGGPSTLENTRLLCRACNQRAAIEYFGLVKMAEHLERSP